MKIKVNVPAIFIAASSSVILLGAYLLATKTTLHPQFFITTCGEVLKNIREHVHFHPEGIVSSLILLIGSIGSGLALWQLVRFLKAHRQLHHLNIVNEIPDELQKVICKHNLDGKIISIIGGNKLTAYTIGLLHPKIIVSRSLIQKLSKEQLEAVILHELYHLRNHHVMWLLFSRLISSLFFFIPLIEYLARELRTEFELAADAFVVRNQKTRDHLCSSLALNLQYSGGVIPHFATSPIEKRVEVLVGNGISFERIGIRPLTLSILSLALMLGMAFIQPTQVAAGFTFETGGICSVEEGCKTTGCPGHDKINDSHNFTPVVPASLPLVSSH